MTQIRILVLANCEMSLHKYEKVLRANGYINIALSTSAHETLRKARQIGIDLFIIEESLQDGSGSNIALNLYELALTNIILLVARDSQRAATQMFSNGDVVVLSQPFSANTLIQAINLYASKITQIKRLTSEIDRLKKSIDDKKIIDKAKWLLIERFEMTEETAYNFMRKMSMDKRTSLVEIAEEILNS